MWDRSHDLSGWRRQRRWIERFLAEAPGWKVAPFASPDVVRKTIETNRHLLTLIDEAMAVDRSTMDGGLRVARIRLECGRLFAIDTPTPAEQVRDLRAIGAAARRMRAFRRELEQFKLRICCTHPEVLQLLDDLHGPEFIPHSNFAWEVHDLIKTVVVAFDENERGLLEKLVAATDHVRTIRQSAGALPDRPSQDFATEVAFVLHTHGVQVRAARKGPLYAELATTLRASRRTGARTDPSTLEDLARCAVADLHWALRNLDRLPARPPEESPTLG